MKLEFCNLCQCEVSQNVEYKVERLIAPVQKIQQFLTVSWLDKNVECTCFCQLNFNWGNWVNPPQIQYKTSTLNAREISTLFRMLSFFKKKRVDDIHKISSLFTKVHLFVLTLFTIFCPICTNCFDKMLIMSKTLIKISFL